MRPLSHASPAAFERVDLVLTDMDDTLTFDGRLAAATYGALERLEDAGVRVVPITAAAAGWCDQMVRMWPVSAVIGENGGLCFSRDRGSIARRYWLDDTARKEARARLDALGESLLAAHPAARLADDQPFRLTSLAVVRPDDRATVRALLDQMEASGARTTLNSIWLLAWLGSYDKLTAARRFLPEVTGHDIDRDASRVVFVGDSANDAPMFSHVANSVGVSTVTAHLADIPKPPAWITNGPGGAGFVEVADAIIAARKPRAPRCARVAEPHA
jgi:HAD superfamily hydrolase (TIGR01484 family)